MNKSEAILFHDDEFILEGSYIEVKNKYDELLKIGGEIKMGVYKPRYKSYLCEKYHFSSRKS